MGDRNGSVLAGPAKTGASPAVERTLIRSRGAERAEIRSRGLGRTAQEAAVYSNSLDTDGPATAPYQAIRAARSTAMFSPMSSPCVDDKGMMKLMSISTLTAPRTSM